MNLPIMQKYFNEQWELFETIKMLIEKNNEDAMRCFINQLKCIENLLRMQENVAPTVAFSAGISHKPPTIRSMSSYDE